MSTSNAGFSARELHRRQFQETAAATLDRQAGVIGQVVEAINQTNEQARVSREFVADLSTRLDDLRADFRFALPSANTFRARLRWLLTGK